MPDDFDSTTSLLEPAEQTIVRPKRRKQEKSKQQPRYHVLLWNDDDHSFDYVIGMMQELFAHSAGKGFMIANDVHTGGRAICLTTTKEHAELKRDQIHAYGGDRNIAQCKGSMSSTIEAEY